MITDPKTGRFVRLHSIVKIHCKCGEWFESTEDRIKTGRGIYCSKPCFYKYRSTKPIKPNAGYSAIHKWMAKQYGQSMQCENCKVKSDNPYNIHWANLDGQYSRDPSTWMRLCAKCHWHLDREGEL